MLPCCELAKAPVLFVPRSEFANCLELVFKPPTIVERVIHKIKNRASLFAGGIVFLHRIEAGAASKSYGIEVARLAGLPAAVIERAKHVLRQHEKQERQSVQVETTPEPMQLTIFTPLSQRIVDRIAATDVNTLTPLQALNLLEELQSELKEKA